MTLEQADRDLEEMERELREWEFELIELGIMSWSEVELPEVE